MVLDEPQSSGQPDSGDEPPIPDATSSRWPAEPATASAPPWPPDLTPGEGSPPGELPPSPEILAHNAPLFAAATSTGTKPRSGGRGRAIGLTAAVVAGVAVLGKLGIGFLTATVVGGALGLAFGGPFERLPADQKQQLEQRFDAAVGKTLDGLTDAQETAKVEALVSSGLVRLDDEPLVERMGLFIAMLKQSDDATCAALARTMGGGQPDDAVVEKSVNSLDTASLGRWYEINLSAIEAEARGTPAARTADVAEVDAIFTKVVPMLSASDTQALVALSEGSEVTDADACAAFRNLYALVGDLEDRELAVMARYDVSP